MQPHRQQEWVPWAKRYWTSGRITRRITFQEWSQPTRDVFQALASRPITQRLRHRLTTWVVSSQRLITASARTTISPEDISLATAPNSFHWLWMQRADSFLASIPWHPLGCNWYLFPTCRWFRRQWWMSCVTDGIALRRDFFRRIEVSIRVLLACVMFQWPLGLATRKDCRSFSFHRRRPADPDSLRN